MRDEDDRIDFSALAPANTDALVRRITAAAYEAQHPLWYGLRRLGAVAVLISACIAAAAWVPALMANEESPVASSSSASIADWAHHGEVPAEVDLLEVTR